MIMKTKIASINSEKITDALRAVNGRASKYVIDDFAYVNAIAEDAEKDLAKATIPKADRSGARVSYAPGGPRAKSYGYSAKSTKVTIERGSRDWFLVAITSSDVYPGQNERTTISVTNKQRAIIAGNALRAFTYKGYRADHGLGFNDGT